MIVVKLQCCFASGQSAYLTQLHRVLHVVSGRIGRFPDFCKLMHGDTWYVTLATQGKRTTKLLLLSLSVYLVSDIYSLLSFHFMYAAVVL